MADNIARKRLKGVGTPIFSLTDHRTGEIILMMHQWEDGHVTWTNPHCDCETGEKKKPDWTPPFMR